MNQKRRIIAIVDDEIEICRLFCDVLKREDKYDVISFNNFLDAINYGSENKIDLLITDYFVPGNIAYSDAIREMKKINRKIKIIIMSGNFSFKEDENIYLADDIIEKPISIKNLLQVVKSVLGD